MDNHRLSVSFSEDAYATLKDLANETGKSMGEIIRNAIAIERWIYDQRKEGGRVLLEKNGEIRELILR